MSPSPPVASLLPGTPPEELPDVLLIVLDAARADHFGAYGYPRETTPRIDRLAAEGFFFRRAYSECPNTSCSIPNLITGLPMLDTGSDLESRRLDDGLTTLAEALRALGYRTVSISGNPNNSIARNAHQGFDLFRETWRELEGRARLDPHLLSEMAIEAIEARPEGRPLYLQLHYVPPHEPYAPKPAFDLFRDPAYDGPVDGTLKATRAFRAGELELDAADVRELIDRYDGNLLMADDAVGQLLDALDAAGRLESALVVVTSDHGEAFLEHGHQGHNSTVYDEMLHVPLVVRLPGGERPAGVDPERLASTADVVPTVLARLGAVPDPRVAGLDLLGPPVVDAETGTGERVLFHRTIPWGEVTYAVRTPAWKAIFTPGTGERQLFDLRRDPGETVDRAAERPAVVAALAERLRRHLALAAELGAGGEATELSAEDEQMLRSLGYL